MNRLWCLLGLHEWLITSERWVGIGAGRIYVTRYICSRCSRTASKES